MKIATWNINSVRSRIDRLVAWLSSAQPDVLCLQELKCTDEQFPYAEVQAAGFHAEVFGQKTYNGVALISKQKPAAVQRNLEDGVDDEQARVIAGTFGGVRVIGVYAPNGQSITSPAYQYKLEWYARLRASLKARHMPEDKVVLCGDMNVAPEPIDVWDPPLFEGQTLFTVPEREAWKATCESLGLVDLYRAKHPEPGKYSWWDYRMLGFPKNRGLRIDHLLVTAPMVAACEAIEIDREARKGKLPSDHAPVWATFAL
jgi:exodeoxyribonuclease-3